LAPFYHQDLWVAKVMTCILQTANATIADRGDQNDQGRR
jgi:hypothetical protein